GGNGAMAGWRSFRRLARGGIIANAASRMANTTSSANLSGSANAMTCDFCHAIQVTSVTSEQRTLPLYSRKFVARMGRIIGMRVADIMTEPPVTVKLNDTLRTAVERMQANNCHRLPVVNADGALVGIVTDRDTRLALQSPFVLHEKWEQDALLDRVTVRECMTSAPITVEPTTDIADAINLMLVHRIGGLPVLRGESIVGIITSTDVMTAFVRYLHRKEG